MMLSLLLAASPSPSGPMVFGLPFGWGAIFSLFAAAISTLLGGGVLGMWIKTRAENRKVEQDGETQLRSEMWADIEKLKLADADKSRRLNVAEGRLVSQSVELGQHRFLIKLVTDELDRVSPGNPVAKQAREMLMEMQRQSLPMPEELAQAAEMLGKLCRIPMSGEGVEE